MPLALFGSQAQGTPQRAVTLDPGPSPDSEMQLPPYADVFRDGENAQTNLVPTSTRASRDGNDRANGHSTGHRRRTTDAGSVSETHSNHAINSRPASSHASITSASSGSIFAAAPPSLHLDWSGSTAANALPQRQSMSPTTPLSPNSGISRFSFLPLPSLYASVLVPAGPAETSPNDAINNALYYISVRSPADIFYPKSWLTTVRRGPDTAGEIVGEFSVGLGDRAVVTMGGLELGVYYAFEGSAATTKWGNRVWKFNPSRRLVWAPDVIRRRDSAERLCWVCKVCTGKSDDAGTKVATFEPTRVFTPAVLKDRDHRQQNVVPPRPVKPSIPPRLEVGQAGLPLLDEIVVSILLSEQMRLTPGLTA